MSSTAGGLYVQTVQSVLFSVGARGGPGTAKSIPSIIINCLSETDGNINDCVCPQVVMDTSEVGLVASQIVTSLGADWDQSGFEELIGNASGFQFGTFLTLLEKRYLADVDRAGLVEALNAVTNTFIDDIIKKVRWLNVRVRVPHVRIVPDQPGNRFGLNAARDVPTNPNVFFRVIFRIIIL